MLSRKGTKLLLMQQPKFVESLISLKDHYQGLNQEYEQKEAHAKEQLAHVNALLVDQLVENQQFVESLITLRTRYQGLNEDCSRQAAHVREQLSHINALLVDQLVLQHNQQPISIQASTVNQDAPPVLTSAADITKNESPTEPDELSEADEPDEADSPTSPTPTDQMQSEADEKESESVNYSTSPNGQSTPVTKTPILPRYDNLTKLEAVESLLGEKAGSILHIDYIIRALHGELEPDAMKVEKGRMTQTLSEGAKKGLWHKVPQQPGCYTIDLKLVEPELSSKDTAQQSKVGFRRRPQFRGNPSNNMLPRYQRMNFTEAVETVVSENAGQILSTEKVARALYGELSGQALTKAKDKIGKTLWSGANQKRWQRVPGRLGMYTLDMKLVAKT